MRLADIFPQLWQSVGAIYNQNPSRITNDAVRQNYLIAPFLMGRGEEETIVAGTRIIERVKLDFNRQTRRVGPTTNQSYANRGGNQNIVINWAETFTPNRIDDYETIIGNGEALATDRNTAAVVDVLAQIEQDMYTDMLEFMDDQMLAVPDFALMEERTASGDSAAIEPAPYSLPAIINEEANGQYPGFTTTCGLPNGGNWMPIQETYDSDTPTTDATDGVIEAVERAIEQADFRPPTRGSTHFEAATNIMRFFILTGYDGTSLWRQAVRQRGDTVTASDNDPSIDAMIRGIPLKAHSRFDNMPIYAGAGGTRVTAANATNPGPRYMGINTDYLCMAFRQGFVYKTYGPFVEANSPKARLLGIGSTHNLRVKSRRRHFHVAPVNDAD